MTTIDSIHEVIKLANLINSQNDEREILAKVLTQSPEELSLWEFLNSLSDHHTIVIRNLMYVGGLLNTMDMTFMDYYNHLSTSLEANRRKAIEKIYEKYPCIPQYLTKAIDFAKDANIDINSL
ncbi:hypothetical protein [Proteus penneri]|uniref:Uncharacterized protein n=1 Tax=Proteus penneri TaxID=102862 RepID=A0A0G4PZA9_9GAMM|nr:hypothetical protein [Proteus penneri]CRL59037.1 hypothetical protein BN1804_00209 [Proteus penneri]